MDFTSCYPSCCSAKNLSDSCVDDHLEVYVVHQVSAILGLDFGSNSPDIIQDNELTGFVIYDVLTRILPVRSQQSSFFWQKVAKPFASMLHIASYPLPTQISFLTFVYATLLDMMGPHKLDGYGSLMTFDGSPVELSWVIPGKKKSCPVGASREVRFAIEPMDACTGHLLSGEQVLRYLTSAKGGMGLVRCEMGALDWSNKTQNFLFPKGENGEEELGKNGRRFFIGFDFAPSGEILLKTYYFPCSRQPLNAMTLNRQRPSLALWDTNYRLLKDLVLQLDPLMIKPLELMVSYTDDLEMSFKPRIQILSMDCVKAGDNRLKLYCRSATGSSWADARRCFTLDGRLVCNALEPALKRLETLWNLLFPFANSQSDRDLDTSARLNRLGELNGHDETQAHPEHPFGGLLFYYSLVSGARMILPKIYLPVSRYCPNDLFIANAMEKFHAIDCKREYGWVKREVSAAYNHRKLSEKSGIHTYITFALKKDFWWEVTSYFSPEVWEE